jgi:hypothetical protein
MSTKDMVEALFGRVEDLEALLSAHGLDTEVESTDVKEKKPAYPSAETSRLAQQRAIDRQNVEPMQVRRKKFLRGLGGA